MAKKDERVVGLLKELVMRLAGKGAEPIVDILFGKKNVNEFKIADKLKLTINQTRNILYRLVDAGIIDSTRKKDKKKGWYTYFWTIDIYKALKASETLKMQEIGTFKNLLKNREMKNFYFCESDSIEMSEETALNHDFSCPECGQLLQPVPREKKMKEISLRIDSLNKKIAIMREELERFKPKAIKPVEKKAVKKKAVKKIIKKKKIAKKVSKPKKKAVKKKAKAAKPKKAKMKKGGKKKKRKK